MQNITKRVIWIITVSRNSIVLILTSLLAYYLIEIKQMESVIEVTGMVKQGIPSWNLPWMFTTSIDDYTDYLRSNSSSNEDQTTLNQAESSQTIDDGPWNIADGIGSGLIFLPLVSMIQVIAIVHNFSPPTKQVDASQEIFALGMCQLVGSFAGSLPITASFGRSTVNSASGVQTPFGGIITGCIVIAACCFLTPHFAFIPTASLSAVIISSVVLTVDVEILLPLWRAKKLDLIPYTATLLIGIFGSVEIGMIIGTSIHLGILLYTSSLPKVIIQEKRVEDTPYILVQPDRSLNFPSVDEIRKKLSEASTTYGKSNLSHNLGSIALRSDNSLVENVYSSGDALSNGKTPIDNLDCPVAIIFDLSQVVDIDFSAASIIRALARSMKEKNGRNVMFCGATQKVENVLQGADADTFYTFCNIEEAQDKLIRG